MPTTDRFLAGARIGDYIVERVLEDGGLDAVHVLLPRKVRLAIAQRPVASVRMMREACILEAIRHPGVPRVFEVGMLADGSHDPWVASESINGESLLDCTMRGGRLQIREVLEVVRDTAEILAYAHKRGVAHRGVRLDAVVRPSRADIAMRGFPLVLVNWGEACLQDGIEDNGRAFADDVFALGLLADLVIASRASAPAKLALLVDDMLSPDPLDRPAAAEVAVRAKLILDGLDTLGDDDIIEENVVLVDLVDISRSAPPPPPPSRNRVRWTPAIGINPTPAQGVVVGVIKPRT
jgi:serine/threonine-protein kinase